MSKPILIAIFVALVAGAGPASKPAEPKPEAVVYVIDPSPSVVGKLDTIKAQVRLAVGVLHPDQPFTIVVAGEEAPRSTRLLPATKTNTAAAEKFLDGIEHAGAVNISAAVAAAVKMRPDVVWVASDGDYDKPAEVLAQIRKAHAGSKSRLNTVLALAGTLEHRHNLWQMAHDNGGVCVNEKGEAADEPKDKAPDAGNPFREPKRR